MSAQLLHRMTSQNYILCSLLRKKLAWFTFTISSFRFNFFFWYNQIQVNNLKFLLCTHSAFIQSESLQNTNLNMMTSPNEKVSKELVEDTENAH